MPMPQHSLLPYWSSSNLLTPLEKEVVHIWSFQTSRPSREVENLAALLSQEEINRAMRMRSLEVREQAIVSRAVLRQFIGGYLRIPPARVGFATRGMGKPVLKEGDVLHFNLSHSHGIGLLAVTRTSEIGVDVEKLRLMENTLFLAQRFFSPWESEYLGKQSGSELASTFFQAWTRKEAFLKANGHGIGFGLDRVEVALGQHESPRLRLVDGCPNEASRWSMLHLEPCHGFMGAAAIAVPNIKALTWHWDGNEIPRPLD